MAEKYLKIIQNGAVSYVPNNQANKNFWAKQNSLVSRSHAAHKETVTIMEATDEEVAFMQHSDVGSSKIAVSSVLANDNSAILEMMNRLQKQNEEQAEKIAALMAKHEKSENAVNVSGDSSNADNPEISGNKEKGKPGPKPKEK